VIGIMRLQATSLWRLPLGWAGLVLLAGLAFSRPVSADPPALREHGQSLTRRIGEPVAVSPLARFAVSPLGAWYDSMYNKMQSWLGTKSHMIQVGCIGMVIALFIIWWRKT
jgi:hypothetical protein